MPRIIPFSQTFPQTHPRKGERTYFVEKMLNALKIDYWEVAYLELLYELNAASIAAKKLTKVQIKEFWAQGLDCTIKEEKHHTIRLGNRWAKEMVFSPNIWTGKPYASYQLKFAPNTLIKNCYHFDLMEFKFWLSGTAIGSEGKLVELVAKNDGLSANDFRNWFDYPKPCNGQIICFTDLIYWNPPF